MNRIDAIRRKTVRRVIGLISGTSMDGVDAALVEIRDEDGFAGADLIHALTEPWPPALRDALRGLHGAGPDEICALNRDVGEAFARTVLRILDEADVEPADCDLVGSHGQTIAHRPGAAGGGSTLQIGEPAVIAERTGIVTVSDFRAADIAAGGQGAPLVPLADYLLFRPEAGVRLLLNIGGIANLTVLTPDRRGVRGFDTGPGNALIDAAVRRFTHGRDAFDAEGARARRGTPNPAMLSELEAHPFFRLAPPKSTGLDTFGEGYVARVRENHPDLAEDDFLATLTAFTARTIGAAIRAVAAEGAPEGVVYVGGGGARNRFLMELLAREIEPLGSAPIDAIGIPGDYREAVAFAVLAGETIAGRPGNLPAVTGAAREVVLGRVSDPGAIPGEHP
jgi:anhydro-N-acetylmuramic acid kinase